MKRILLLVLLALASTAGAQSDAQREAEALLDSMNLETTLERTVDEVIKMQVQQNPELAEFQGVMIAFLKKHMSYESLKPDLVAMYAETFTVEELRELTDFYRTDVGQKAIKVMPEMMARGGRLGFRRVEENMPELFEMIDAEKQRRAEAQADTQAEGG